MKPSSTQPRLHFLDELRGLAVLCMVFFHGFYTMSETFGMAWGTRLLHFFQPAEIYFAGFFILLSGFSCRLSRSNLKRGGILFGLALGLTAVTFLLDQMGMAGVVIWFGILHLLSVGMLLFALLKPLLDRIPPAVGLLVCGLLFLFFLPLEQGAVGFPPLWEMAVPEGFYQSVFLAPLGFYPPTFFSADYFPLLPWLFLFLAGSFLGVTAEKKRYPAFFTRLHLPPLSWVGRHALPIYLAHQPVIFGVLWVVSFLTK